MEIMKIHWQWICTAWIILGVITFFALLLTRIRPPFGRHTRPGWGPEIDNRLGWFVMEVPSLICLWVAFLAVRSPSTPTGAWLPMVLWTIHYGHRSFLYPLRLRGSGKRMPLAIAGSAIFFNLVNGTLNGVFLGSGWFLMTPGLVAVGLVFFIAGMLVNLVSDGMLIRLRAPGETGYKIPHGFLFRYVTAPNHLGEMLEWLGFFLVAPSLASLSFWIWTVANLAPRARDHHEWYRKKFRDYPKDRKILLPGIW